MWTPVFVCEGSFEVCFAADLPRSKGLWPKNVKYEYWHNSCSIIKLQNVQFTQHMSKYLVDKRL